MNSLIITTFVFLSALLWTAKCQPVNSSKPRCPPGTANAGWFIEHAYSFRDPYDCCDSKVKGWEAVDDYETPYVETGCAISYPVQETVVTRFLYPSSCQSDFDCGETSFYGSRMTCCNSQSVETVNPDTQFANSKKSTDSKSGFCAALKHDGSDRCKKSAEIAEWVNNGDGDQIDYDTFAGQCYSSGSGNHVCLSCAQECPDGAVQGRMSSRMSATEKFVNAISVKKM